MADTSAGLHTSALSDPERAAFEERLGFTGSYASAWGRVVADYLFAQHVDRQMPLLAHALSVYPYVQKVPEDRFASKPVSDRRWHACLRRHSPQLHAIVREAVGSAHDGDRGAAPFAHALLAFLGPLPNVDRACCIGYVLRQLGVTPFGVFDCPVQEFRDGVGVSQLSHPEAEAVLVVHRAEAITLRAILSHAPHFPSPEFATGAALTVLDRVADRTARAVLLRHLLDQVSKGVRVLVPIPAGVLPVAAMGAVAAPDAERGRVEGGSEADADFSADVLDYLLGREPKAKA